MAVTIVLLNGVGVLVKNTINIVVGYKLGSY